MRAVVFVFAEEDSDEKALKKLGREIVDLVMKDDTVPDSSFVFVLQNGDHEEVVNFGKRLAHD